VSRAGEGGSEKVSRAGEGGREGVRRVGKEATVNNEEVVTRRRIRD
jgi:hypothetical protein